MSDQPDALYLADVIENDPQSKAHHDAAASCLRRQHFEIEGLKAVRDALLESLKRMASIIDKMGDMPDGFIHPSPWQMLRCEEALTQARAAIAKAAAENVH